MIETREKSQVVRLENEDGVLFVVEVLGRISRQSAMRLIEELAPIVGMRIRMMGVVHQEEASLAQGSEPEPPETLEPTETAGDHEPTRPARYSDEPVVAEPEPGPRPRKGRRGR